MQRRDFILSAALVPGLGLVPGVAGAVAGSSQAATATSTASSAAGAAGTVQPILASAGAIGTQSDLLGGFHVVNAFDVFHGAMPFILEGEGERFQLDVLRRTESGAMGMHATEHFVFFAHGAGGPTQERGARALGIALEREIRDGAAVPVLASFEERRDAANGAKLHVDYARADEASAPTQTPSV